MLAVLEFLQNYMFVVILLITFILSITKPEITTVKRVAINILVCFLIYLLHDVLYSHSIGNIRYLVILFASAFGAGAVYCLIAEVLVRIVNKFRKQ